MNRHILMFGEEFAAKVKNGTKRQTIRKKRKIPFQKGDILVARKWIGKAYRSKQQKILESEIVKVQNIWIKSPDITVDGTMLENSEIYKLIRNDGFPVETQIYRFFAYFQDNDDEPFEGQIIHWK